MRGSFDNEFKMSHDDKSIHLFEKQHDHSTTSNCCASVGNVVATEMFKSASSSFLDDEEFFGEADFGKERADVKAGPCGSDEQSMESRSNSFLNLINRIFRTSKSYGTQRRQSENDQKKPGGSGCQDLRKSDGSKYHRSASADELDQRDRKGSPLRWLNKRKCPKAASVTLVGDQRPVSESSLTTGKANSQPMAKLKKGGRQHLESTEER